MKNIILIMGLALLVLVLGCISPIGAIAGDPCNSATASSACSTVVNYQQTLDVSPRTANRCGDPAIQTNAVYVNSVPQIAVVNPDKSYATFVSPSNPTATVRTNDPGASAGLTFTGQGAYSSLNNAIAVSYSGVPINGGSSQCTITYHIEFILPATQTTTVTSGGTQLAGPVCGNAVCDSGETFANCPQDCQVVGQQARPLTIQQQFISALNGFSQWLINSINSLISGKK